MIKRKGTTLIELVVVMVLTGIMVSAFSQIYVNGMKTYREQLAQTRLESDAQTITDKVTSDIKESAGIEATYLTHTSSADTLILKTPAVDADQNFLYSGENLKFDYIIYYKDGANFHRIIFADALSTRYSENGRDKILSNKTTGTTFTYDPDINAPGKISITLTLSEKAGKVTKKATVIGKAKLRNNI